MAEKPTKIAFRYESWRGSAEHLVELGKAVQAEVERAQKAANQRADEDVNAFLRQARTEFEQSLRTKGGLAAGAPLTPKLQAEWARGIAAAEQYRDQRKRENEGLIKRGTQLTFGYTIKGGHFPSSESPEILARVNDPEGVSMRGFVLGPPRASMTVTLQNRPWETLSFEVEGEDPDWVSSAATPLDSFLANRESKVVRFFRNRWVKGIFGILVWALFIPPVGFILERFGIERLLAVVIAILPVGFVSSVYEWLTRPLLITKFAPSLWTELGRVGVSGLVAGSVRVLLDYLARIVSPP